MIPIALAAFFVAGIVVIDLAIRMPQGKGLIDRSGVRLLLNCGFGLWWLVTVCYRYWGFEIYLYPRPYWSCTVGYNRKVGVWWKGVGLLIYLGRTKRDDFTVRTEPSLKWYEWELR